MAKKQRPLFTIGSASYGGTGARMKTPSKPATKTKAKAGPTKFATHPLGGFKNQSIANYFAGYRKK
jgi:hypothetical protein